MRVEVLGGVERRRRWSDDEKMRIIAETLAPGAKVAAVARRHGVSPSLLFFWRRQARTVAKNDITPRFAPVRIAASDADLEIAKGSSEASDRARTSAMPAVRGSMIEIDLGRGRRIRVDAQVDADALARVIDVLERR
jgi:transposase